jgi:hypothetical protein
MALSLIIDFAHAVGVMGTSLQHAIFAIHVFVKHEDVQKVFTCYAVPFEERFHVPPHVVGVLVQMRLEHWEAYHFHAIYRTP